MQCKGTKLVDLQLSIISYGFPQIHIQHPLSTEVDVGDNHLFEGIIHHT